MSFHYYFKLHSSYTRPCHAPIRIKLRALLSLVSFLHHSVTRVPHVPSLAHLTLQSLLVFMLFNPLSRTQLPPFPHKLTHLLPHALLHQTLHTSLAGISHRPTIRQLYAPHDSFIHAFAVISSLGHLLPHALSSFTVTYQAFHPSLTPLTRQPPPGFVRFTILTFIHLLPFPHSPSHSRLYYHSLTYSCLPVLHSARFVSAARQAETTGSRRKNMVQSCSREWMGLRGVKS